MAVAGAGLLGAFDDVQGYGGGDRHTSERGSAGGVLDDAAAGRFDCAAGDGGTVVGFTAEASPARIVPPVFVTAIPLRSSVAPLLACIRF